VSFARGPCLSYVGRGIYETVGESEYVGDRDVIRIPHGFRTDLASIPRVFWWLMAPTGVWEKAAVLHDWAVTDGLREGRISSSDADGLFRRVVREHQEMEPKRCRPWDLVVRWWLWNGVRLGALVNPVRRPGIARDMPLVLGITALTLAAVAALIYGADAAVHALI
jgi:hypothetical protein